MLEGSSRVREDLVPMAVAAPGLTEPSSEVTLSISCRNLLDKDVFSKSDPIVVVYDSPAAEGQGKWTEVSQEATLALERTTPSWHGCVVWRVCDCSPLSPHIFHPDLLCSTSCLSSLLSLLPIFSTLALPPFTPYRHPLLTTSFYFLPFSSSLSFPLFSSSSLPSSLPAQNTSRTA